MSEDTLITVNRLSRHYGPIMAVNNISFELKRGEVLGFLGPNGAGKSTSMQMITGNLAPSSGSIEVCGIDLLDNPKQAKANIGYLPEQPPVYKELTVEEFLRFAARINRIEKTAITGAVERAMQRCGLNKVSHRLIGNLSKGYQQRVGIAQAIIHSPAIIVLDEPTVGLDPIQIREIRSLIRELGQEHGVILSTHILPEVQMTCDRVQIIRNGELVYQDSMDTLNRRTQAKSLLLGLENEIDASQLNNLPDVAEVEQLGPGRWRLSFDNEPIPVSRIANEVVAKGWSLTELTPEQQTLEQIFVDITTSETTSSTLQHPEQAA